MAEVPLTAVHEALLENKKSKKEVEVESDEDNSSDNLNVNTVSDEEDSANQSNWVFVNQEEVPEYMKCNIICCNVFAAPQLLTCCGKNVCKRCIDSHTQRAALLGSERKPFCPHCRKEDFRLIPNTALELSINQLKVECPCRRNGCGWSGPLKHAKLHVKECKFGLIDCPNQCGRPKFERGKLRDHVTVCPLQHINCPFQAVGCDSKALFLRTEWNQVHAVDNLHQHLLLIAQENARVSSECESTSVLRNAIHQNCIKENTATIQFQNTILESLKLVIKSLGDSLQETRGKISSLKHVVAAEKICLVELERKGTQMESTNTALAETLEEVKALTVPEPSGISCTQPVTFTIDKFRKRMSVDDTWRSPPFYTHKGGYKMCISVQPNGYASARKKYMSVGIHFLTGEYDDYLTWPFPGAVITLTVVASQYHSACCNASTHFVLSGEDTRHVRSRQINGDLGCDVKVFKCLDHRKLLSYFLNRDCLQLMVYRIQFLPL